MIPWFLTVTTLFFFITMDNLIDSLGEGCGSSMGTMRVFSTKTHATQPRQEHAPSHPIRKRSYKRAIKRVQLHGFTWYQGQLLTSQHVMSQCPARSAVVSSPLPTTNNIRRRHSNGYRYSCLTWNVGGLTRESWDSFNEWLTLQDIDIILLQESHWKHTSEWMQGRYFCLHSGGKSHSGVLTMISKSFCTADSISWADIFPGRILHTRLYFSTRALDIVNVYQFVNGHSRIQERASFWTALHSTLSDLPTRNLLVVGGDFNTSLSHASSSVGVSSYQHDSFRCTGPLARDEDRFIFLMAQFDQSNRKQARTHKCIVFLQFAMLQEFHRRHQTLDSDAPSPAPIPMVTDSTPSPETYDTMEDDSLALLLQQAVEQDPYKLDDPVAAFAWSDTLNQTVVKTSDGMFAIDTEALPLMDMPSYSRDIPLNNAVLAFTHSSFLTSTPRTLDHVAKGDYLAIWKDVDALYFMSRRCVCCGASFTFELAAKHTASHWGDITNLPDGIYPDCASHFFANFLALPWFQNTPCYRAVLHQTLLLRLLIELWEDGSLGCGDASDVEASLVRRRIAAGLQASQDRPSTTFEKKSQTQQQSARSRSRSRHQSGEDVESPGDQARGHVERAAATATVHPSLERRDGIVDPPNDEKQHGVAPGSGENTSTPPKTGTSALHHPATKTAALTSGETRGRDLPEWDEESAAHRTAHLPLPDMVSEISAPHSEQGQSPGEGGTIQSASAAVRSQC